MSKVVPLNSWINPTLFPLYINDLSDDVSRNIAICADDTTPCSKLDQTSDLWHQRESWSSRVLTSALESNLRNTVECGLGQEMACKFQCWKDSFFFRLTGLITLVLLIWEWMCMFLSLGLMTSCLNYHVTLIAHAHVSKGSFYQFWTATSYQGAGFSETNLNVSDLFIYLFIYIFIYLFIFNLFNVDELT